MFSYAHPIVFSEYTVIIVVLHVDKDNCIEFKTQCCERGLIQLMLVATVVLTNALINTYLIGEVKTVL